VQGIVHIVWLPKDMGMNAEFFLPEILEPISQKLQMGSPAHKLFTIVHMDNT
jgi:hypothetical protein